MLEAARLLPAHRRLPHVTFLNLLALQPERVVACLSNLHPRSRSISATVLQNFASKALARAATQELSYSWPFAGSFPHADSLPSGAVAIPKGVFAMLQTMAFPGRCRIHLTYYVIGNPINSSDMLSHTG